jgi:hypothetical protein
LGRTDERRRFSVTPTEPTKGGEISGDESWESDLRGDEEREFVENFVDQAEMHPGESPVDIIGDDGFTKVITQNTSVTAVTDELHERLNVAALALNREQSG